jgi:hypothetical protein
VKADAQRAACTDDCAVLKHGSLQVASAISEICEREREIKSHFEFMEVDFIEQFSLQSTFLLHSCLFEGFQWQTVDGWQQLGENT